MFGPPSSKSLSSSSTSSIPKYDGISGASTISFNPDNTSKYTIKFDGKEIETTVTDKATIIDQWVQDINNDLYAANLSVIVGLNVERSATNYKSATLHLCIDKKCLIVQLFYVDNLPLSLKNFLMNPNFFFVGFSFAQDISKIYNEHGLNCGGVRADIKDLAVRKWPGRWNRPPSLKDLAMDVVGLSIKKPNLVSLNNWDIRVLSIEQVEYGCIEAYVSYKVGHKLLRDD